VANKFENKLGGIVAGTAAVELADSAAVQGVFADIAQAAGSDVVFNEAEMTPVGEFAHGIVDTAQSFALPLATVLILWAGLKKMTEGFSSDRRRR
jgi:hypothetical protein